MKKHIASAGVLLMMAAGLPGADNVLTPQEKASGWVLLFDGKTLEGWDSTVPQAAAQGRGGGAGRVSAGAPKQAKGVSQPAAAAAVGSNPRACATSIGKAGFSAGSSHWEVLNGVLSPCGDTP